MRSGQLWTAAAIGALAGARSVAPFALLAGRKHARGGLSRGTARVASAVAGGAQLFAAGEVIADKLPGTPARIAPAPLFGRLVSGAIAGAIVSPRDRLAGALLGCAAAVAASFVLYGLRKLSTERLKVPGVLAGLAEDALVFGASARIRSAIA